MQTNEKEKWLKYAHVISSKNKVRIIKLLKNGPSTPTNLSEKVDINTSIVSRLLKDMTNENIIACLNPNERKGKLFYLTEIGNWIAELI